MFVFLALLRVTVDGGTNKWHSFVKQNAFNCLKIPDLITGDFDSADPSIIEQYVSKGSTVIHTPNQNEIDFFKALVEVNKYSASNNIVYIICTRPVWFILYLFLLFRKPATDRFCYRDGYHVPQD